MEKVNSRILEIYNLLLYTNVSFYKQQNHIAHEEQRSFKQKFK